MRVPTSPSDIDVTNVFPSYDCGPVVSSSRFYHCALFSRPAPGWMRTPHVFDEQIFKATYACQSSQPFDDEVSSRHVWAQDCGGLSIYGKGAEGFFLYDTEMESETTNTTKEKHL